MWDADNVTLYYLLHQYYFTVEQRKYFLTNYKITFNLMTDIGTDINIKY